MGPPRCENGETARPSRRTAISTGLSWPTYTRRRCFLKVIIAKFLFHSTVVARFKKGNSRGVGSNIETQAVIDFIDPQASFEGLPDLQRVEIVYQLNILGTDYAEVAVVARNKYTRVWAYPLGGRPSADIIPLPTPVRPILTPPKVTPKPAAEEKAADQSPSE